MNIEDQPTAVQVDLWRQKAINKTLTDEEARQALRFLRQSRSAAAVAGAAKRAKAPVKSGDELLAEFDNMP
jgi:ribosomal protein L12E/L44/L45/RPP1/RPP2